MKREKSLQSFRYHADETLDVILAEVMAGYDGDEARSATAFFSVEGDYFDNDFEVDMFGFVVMDEPPIAMNKSEAIAFLGSQSAVLVAAWEDDVAEDRRYA